jgi:(p)ppGpp synthase/HD superfamily hydrolase
MLTPLETAIQLAVRAHCGQIDTDDNDMPHIVHCMEVMLAVKQELESRPRALKVYSLENILVAAILHDAVEDSFDNSTALERVDLQRVRSMFGDNVANIVDSVTRRQYDQCETCGKPKSDFSHSHEHFFRPKKESYRDFIYRAREDEGGRIVKVADLQHNLKRTNNISEKKASWRRKLQYKYPIALRVLLDLAETWEQASWESNVDAGSEMHYFIADPNGKRQRVTEKEFNKALGRAE